MRETKYREVDKKITVDIDTLAAMLSCGHATARKIGDEAQAKVVVGRRVLYSVGKIEKYLDDISF